MWLQGQGQIIEDDEVKEDPNPTISVSEPGLDLDGKDNIVVHLYITKHNRLV